MNIDVANLGPPLRGENGIQAKKPEKASDAKEARGQFADILEKKNSSEDRVSIKSDRKESPQKQAREPRPESEANNRGPIDRRMSGEKAQQPKEAEANNDSDREVIGSKTNGFDRESDESESATNDKSTLGQKVPAKQRAMQKFMDSVESEFSIPPTRIVEAMAQLKDQQLAQSPEETVDAVVEKLGLEGKDVSKAKTLYRNMLEEVRTADRADEKALKRAIGVAAALEVAQRLQEKMPENQQETAVLQQNSELAKQNAQGPLTDARATHVSKRHQLNHSLDQLNSSFFVNPRSAQAMDVTGLQDAKAMSPDEVPLSFRDKPQVVSEMEFAKPGTMIRNSADPNIGMNSAQAQGLKTEWLEALGIDPDQIEVMADEDNTDASAGLVAQQPDLRASNDPRLLQSRLDANQMGSVQAKSNASRGMDSYARMKEALGSVQPREVVRDGKASAKSVTPDKTDAAAPRADFFVQQDLKQDTRFDGQLKAQVGAAAGKNNIADADAKQNVQTILNQTQSLAQKGGGEMKIQLNPEGLGEIQLKVAVRDGKVNVQMQAQTTEAKKLIETSVHDLKNSLAAHKLSVDNVRVDLSHHNANSDFSQQQSMAGRQDQQDAARQFMQQFQEQNQARREAMFSMPGRVQYNGPKEKPLEPAPVERTRQTDGKGGGLNLVA